MYNKTIQGQEICKVKPIPVVEHNQNTAKNSPFAFHTFQYSLKNLLLTAFTCLTISASQAQSIDFQWDSSQVFLAVDIARIAFADVDNDGDQDLLLTGHGSGPTTGSAQTSLFFNDGSGNFTISTTQNFTALKGGSVIFFDADNDGDQDLFINGQTHGGSYLSTLYFNDGNGNFTLAASNFVPVTGARCDVGDVDGDGDMDIIIAGNAGDSPANPQHHTKLYLNNGQGIFTLVSIPFENLTVGAAKFFDMDNDGDSDLVICGKDEQQSPRTLLYENLANTGNVTFSLSSNTMDGFSSGDLDAGDVDGDGDIDIIICGETTTGIKTKILLNNGVGQFTEMSNAPFPGVLVGAAKLVDFDNDGDLDVLIAGSGSAGIITRVYENQGNNSFVAAANLIGYYLSDVATADVNGDGKVDVIVGGTSFFQTPNSPLRATRLFLNETIIAGTNTPEVAVQRAVKVYPNPSSNGIFQLQTEEPVIARFFVYDNLGRLVFTDQINGTTKQINLLHLNAGIYHLSVQSSQFSYSTKIVVKY